jgi:hypothetical protein
VVSVGFGGGYWCMLVCRWIRAAKERENERKEMIFSTAFILPHDSISW